MIKAVIFDLGGVVLTHTKEITLEILSQIFRAGTKDIKEFYETFEDDWVTGRIKDKDVIAKYKARFSAKKSVDEILEQWEKLYRESTEVDKAVLQIIDNLRKQGYKVYLLTDTTDIHHKFNLKRDLFGHFDRVFASFIEGKRKTTRDFYEHFLEKTDLKPNECIFIDDRESNLKIAESVGIYTILFKDYKTLARKLKDELPKITNLYSFVPTR